MGPSPTNSSGTSASGRTWGPAVRPTSVDGRSWTCGPAWRTAVPDKPFEHDTATVIFSCTKGIMAICAYLLVQEGRLDLDVPMARYWPEFAQGGKEAITLRQALAHRAGLAYLDRDLTTAEVLAWDPVIRAIEEQVPHHAPTDGHAYHAVTIGWLVGEVIRRITGLTPGHVLPADARRSARARHLDRPARVGTGSGRLHGASASRRRLGVRERVRELRFRPSRHAHRNARRRLRLPGRERVRDLQRAGHPGRRDPRAPAASARPHRSPSCMRRA